MRIFLTIFLLLFFGVGMSCSDTDFASQAVKNSKGSGNGDDDDDDDRPGYPNGNDDDDDDGGLEIGDDETYEMNPISCDSTNVEVVRGSELCPKYSAAFTIDDGSNTRLSCCSLPIKNMLDQSADKVTANTCPSNSIAVGSAGTQLVCQKLNTDKYVLATPEAACYRGTGSGGYHGSAKCSGLGAYHDEIAAMIALENDRDGCIAYPFGSVVVSKIGKDCIDMKGAQVLDKDTMQPVQMFP